MRNRLHHLPRDRAEQPHNGSQNLDRKATLAIYQIMEMKRQLTGVLFGRAPL
jgi:hypothetical protein